MVLLQVILTNTITELICSGSNTCRDVDWYFLQQTVTLNRNISLTPSSEMFLEKNLKGRGRFVGSSKVRP